MFRRICTILRVYLANCVFKAEWLFRSQIAFNRTFGLYNKIII